MLCIHNDPRGSYILSLYIYLSFSFAFFFFCFRYGYIEAFSFSLFFFFIPLLLPELSYIFYCTLRLSEREWLIKVSRAKAGRTGTVCCTGIFQRVINHEEGEFLIKYISVVWDGEKKRKKRKRKIPGSTAF